MAKDRRTGWIAELEQGDSVCVCRGHQRDKVQTKVERVTPSGQVVAWDGKRFNYDGWMLGGSRGPFGFWLAQADEAPTPKAPPRTPTRARR